MQSLANRKGIVESISANRGRTQLEATIPTRGLIGFEFELLNLTSGEGIMSHLFKEYRLTRAIFEPDGVVPWYQWKRASP